MNAGYLATSRLERTQTIAMPHVLQASVISFVTIKHRESQIQRQTIMAVLWLGCFCQTISGAIVLWKHFQIDNNQKLLQMVTDL